MRHYETIYIVNPDLADEDYRAILEKFNDLVEKQKGIIIKSQEWGKKSLAYGIKNFNKGFYVLIEFCADQGCTNTLERSLRLDDRILKYQTIKLANKADPDELKKKEEEKEEKKKESVVEEDQQNNEASAIKNGETKPDGEVENGI